MNEQPKVRPDYYAKGGSTKYVEGQDPEVTCGHCGKTFLCDMLDAACRLCGKFYRDAPAQPEGEKMPQDAWEVLVEKMAAGLTPEQTANVSAVLEAVDNALGKDRDFNKAIVTRMFQYRLTASAPV